MKTDVVIVGGGAAGLFCAIEAGKRGRSVVVIEHNDTAGRKIRISGGGRCNFTNTHTAPQHFISENPHFHKSALVRFSPGDFIALVRRHGIPFHEKKLGQLFCDRASDDILRMIHNECAASRVRIETGCRVHDIREAGGFVLETSHGEFACKSLVIATGGLSIPKIGATDFGYRIADKFGVRITDLQPGLVPLTFSGLEGAMFRDLAGVSTEVTVRCGPVSFRENVLFTHRGLSGPAILQISSYWKPGMTITLDLAPGRHVQAALDDRKNARLQPRQILAGYLPARLAESWGRVHAPQKPIAQCSGKELREFADRFHSWEIRPDGDEGYARAEVTRGGIRTSELSSTTMECRRVPGLYFIGEVVDVTGQLGGFNFQWAWASGFAAGQAV